MAAGTIKALMIRAANASMPGGSGRESPWKEEACARAQVVLEPLAAASADETRSVRAANPNRHSPTLGRSVQLSVRSPFAAARAVFVFV